MIRSVRVIVGSALALLAASPFAQAQTVVVAFGDSNTYGMNMSREEAYPAQLEAILKSKGKNVQVINAGTPGATSADGLARVDSAVPAGTRVAIVEFGVNDGRRGVSPSEIQQNLSGILSRLKARGVRTVLCFRTGPPPPGYDKNAYLQAFHKAGSANGAAKCNFREGIPQNGYQADGHENAVGTAAVARNIARIIGPML